MGRAPIARPRVSRDFQAGDIVAYWRDQKWNQGTLSKGGRRYGSGIVLGLINRNVVMAHRTHIIHCAREQVRFATNEEKALLSDPQNQLLGIKDLMGNGTFRSSQFHDLISQAYPPQEEHVLNPQGVEAQIESFGRAVAESADVPVPQPPVDARALPVHDAPEAHESTNRPAEEVIDKSAMKPVQAKVSTDATAAALPSVDQNKEISASSESYSPVRRTRIPIKAGPLTLYRPTPTKHDDFVDILHDVLLQLLDETTRGLKRSAEGEAEASSSKASKKDAEHEIHFVQYKPSAAEAHEDLQRGVSHEVLISQFMQIHHSNNSPLIQAQVEAAKVTGWNTLVNNNAVCLVLAGQAEWIKENQQSRIMGNRFVITKKALEDVVENCQLPQVDNLDHWKVKARFCLQGHLDPDLSEKAESGQLQSPIVSQMGRTVLFQLLASYKWKLQLGDVQGAFLEAGPIPER